jgi:hypothetical protein
MKSSRLHWCVRTLIAVGDCSLALEVAGNISPEQQFLAGETLVG